MWPDLRVYALIDPAHVGTHELATLAGSLVKGGVTLVQLRDKASDTRLMIQHAMAVLRGLAGTGVPLLVNDRVDVALAVKAQGAHIGQEDMPAERARELLGPDAILGLSVRTRAEARAAPVHVLDYVALGGVFATSSKTNKTKPIGLDGLRDLAAIIRARQPGMPICAIAGIDQTNAGGVIAAGVDGIAVISALCKAEQPEQAARQLRSIVDGEINNKGRQA